MDACTLETESEWNGSKRKQEHNTAESPPSKIPRSNSPVAMSAVEATVPPVTITDLDDLCLEKIFGHLDLHSLFNVAASNAYLRPAAQFIYKRKFGQRMVCLTAMDNFKREPSKLRIYETIVIVFSLKSSLEYLRCLGASISLLSIMYRNSGSKWSECIDRYIKNYCSESLLTHAVLEKTSTPIAFDGNPFVGVRNAVVMNSDLTNQFASLPQWFPNLNVLELLNVRMYDRSIDRPFQHLQRLAIDVNNGTRRNGFTKQEAAHLLRLCPAVVSLQIRMPAVRHGMTLKTLANMIKTNRTIQQLRVSMARYWWIVEPAEIQQFVSEHSTISSIWLENYIFTADTATAMMSQLAELKHLKIQMKNPLECTELVRRLGEKWKSTESLDLSGRFYVELNKNQ